MWIYDFVRFLSDCVSESGRPVRAGTYGSIAALEVDALRVTPFLGGRQDSVFAKRENLAPVQFGTEEYRKLIG